MLCFKGGEVRGYILYPLQISYQLELFGLVFPRDLVGDRLGVTFSLQSEGCHLYVKYYSSVESHLVFAGEELEF